MNGRYRETELVAAGEALGRALPPGAVVWLTGELGAGKTTLARAIARGRGVAEPATSPTFDLVHRYQGAFGAVYHVDCFRLRSPDEAAELDWQTLGSGDALLVEWPERAGAWVPAPSLRLDLAHAPDETVRLVTQR